MKLIVSDASPLIILARSDLIPVLTGIVEEVIVPETVYAECTADITLPGAKAVRAAVETGRLQVRADLRHSSSFGEELAGLDAGELAAIHMAAVLKCPVLMDERLGRQAARRQGLKIIGSAGLLLAAKQRGLIPALEPILDQWRKAGYFLSDRVVQAVLDRADEAHAHGRRPNP